MSWWQLLASMLLLRAFVFDHWVACSAFSDTCSGDMQVACLPLKNIDTLVVIHQTHAILWDVWLLLVYSKMKKTYCYNGKRVIRNVCLSNPKHLSAGSPCKACALRKGRPTCCSHKPGRTSQRKRWSYAQGAGPKSQLALHWGWARLQKPERLRAEARLIQERDFQNPVGRT